MCRGSIPTIGRINVFRSAFGLGQQVLQFWPIRPGVEILVYELGAFLLEI